MNEALKILFWILVFPGFLFTLIVGLLLSWVVRKVSALVQWRVGPPLLQPLFDVIKLMGKEILIPKEANRGVFIMAPIAAMAAIMLLSAMLWRITIAPSQIFVGDVIVAIYLMTLPSLALILGSSASASPHAAIGTSREMKLILAYELPLVMALVVVIIKTGGQISLAEIAQSKPIFSISGAIAFLVSLLTVQAKLGFVPFDIAEAESEIASGVMMEYSGATLAIWKITQAMMLAALPLFLVMVFLGGFGMTAVTFAAGIAKYILVVVLLILIKNTNPRLRIDQAMKFFWVYCGLGMAVAVAMAIIGSTLSIGWL
jgi:NADH-quinone oxidoreductase subunit H